MGFVLPKKYASKNSLESRIMINFSDLPRLRREAAHCTYFDASSCVGGGGGARSSLLRPRTGLFDTKALYERLESEKKMNIAKMPKYPGIVWKVDYLTFKTAKFGLFQIRGF